MFESKPSQTYPTASAGTDRLARTIPLDLRQHRFSVAFRGFDRAEVAAFLTEVGEDYERAVQEVERLQQDVRRMEVLLEEYRGHERHLRNALLTAQEISDGIRGTAEQDSRRIMGEAEARSSLLLHQARERVAGTEHTIADLIRKRQDVEKSLEGAIAGLRRSVEFIREQERRDEQGQNRLRPSDQSSSATRDLAGPWPPGPS